MNDIELSVEARVANGAAWLDDHQSGWERRVDLSELDLMSCCRCVLGQVFAVAAGAQSTGYDYALDILEPSMETRNLGFSDPSSKGSRELDEAWIGLLKERFSSGTLSDQGAA